ncbi:MAG: response regulator transcription factor [bacterium]|nr:response regulator transcription factor [bacterium]
MSVKDKLILVIDDDEKLNALLKDYLGNFGFNVTTITHPSKALKTIKTHPPNPIILDIMLPDMDGFETCKEIRKTTTTPIIMLTARGEVTDRIVGLELGADDYLPKPFEPRELVARIQTVLRRLNTPTQTNHLTHGTLKINTSNHTVYNQGKELDLTTMEFKLLTLLAKNPGTALSRDQIMEKLSGIDWENYDRSIDVLISRLRQKLGDHPKHPKFIRTVWGYGYKFIGDQNET